MTCLARGLSPERLGSSSYVLTSRAELLKEAMRQLKSSGDPSAGAVSSVDLQLQRTLQTSRFAVKALDAIAALV